MRDSSIIDRQNFKGLMLQKLFLISFILIPYFSLAETVISALKSFETGQPVSAAFTAASNLVLSAP
jgi:hypothetical protein